MIQKSKTCPKCKKTYKLNKTNFHKHHATKTGYSCYCKECGRERRREWHRKNPLAAHKQNIKRLYGITYEEYLEILEKQNNRCAICNLTLKEAINTQGRGKARHFHIDHNHKTGEIRGLLCTLCNQGIGKLKHNPYILINAIKYLEFYKKRSDKKMIVECQMCFDLHNVSNWKETDVFICVICANILSEIKKMEIKQGFEMSPSMRINIFDSKRKQIKIKN